jgi:hypothetical protein
MTIKQPKSWRDQIKVHPAAELLPMMPPDELKALGEDIEQNGLWTNIAVWRTDGGRPWFLVDGRNRLDGAELVGLSVEFIKKGGDVAVKVGNHMYAVDDLTSMDPYEWVIRANVHRRHLTPEQKRDVIAKLLKAQPEKSNRQVAKAVGVSHPHVAAVRAELEKTGDVETVTTSIDTKGRKQRAHKPAKKPPEDEPAQAEGAFPVHFGSCHGGRVVTERTGTKPKAKAADAPGLAQTDPDHLIALFIAHVRASSLDIMRQTDAAYQPRFIERLREVIDEIEIEAERWAKEARTEEMPGIPEFLRRN